MLLNLPPELESKLARIAAGRGCDAEALAREAIERFLDYDARFIQEVNKVWPLETVANSSNMTTCASS